MAWIGKWKNKGDLKNKHDEIGKNWNITGFLNVSCINLILKFNGIEAVWNKNQFRNEVSLLIYIVFMMFFILKEWPYWLDYNVKRNNCMNDTNHNLKIIIELTRRVRKLRLEARWKKKLDQGIKTELAKEYQKKRTVVF